MSQLLRLRFALAHRVPKFTAAHWQNGSNEPLPQQTPQYSAIRPAFSPGLFSWMALGILCICTFSAQASTKVQEVSCKDLAQWSQTSWEADKHLRKTQYVKWQSHSAHTTQLLAGLKDQNFKPLFGKSIKALSELDVNALIAKFKQCVSGQQTIHAAQQLRNKCTNSRNRQSAECKRSQQFDGDMTLIRNYMGMILGADQSKQSPTHMSKVIASQQEIYQKHDEVNAFIQNNHPDKKTYEIALIAIDTLRQLQHAKVLNFAETSAKSNFLNAIKRKQIAIADQLLAKHMQQLEKPVSNLAELKTFAQFYNKVIKEMGRYNATRWDEFTTRYNRVYAQHAQAMLPIFKTYLDNLPETQISINTAHQTIQALFPYTNAPQEKRNYSTAVTRYSQELSQRIVQRQCDDKLARFELTQYKDEAMLGARGVMSFGEFICGLNENRFKFDEIEASGFFSSQLKAHFITPQGVTLTLVLEPKEVARGKEVLVGRTMINGGDELQLSTKQWQAQVASML